MRATCSAGQKQVSQIIFCGLCNAFQRGSATWDPESGRPIPASMLCCRLPELIKGAVDEEAVLAPWGMGEGSRSRLLELDVLGNSLEADSMAAEKLPDCGSSYPEQQKGSEG